MKTIVCYGDSNTYGADPSSPGRFSRDVRWTGVLAKLLGKEYHIVEEGLNGRTTRWDDPIELGRNGLTTLQPILESHNPIDLVTIMLGTNDLKARFNLNASDIAQSAGALGQLAKNYAKRADGRPARILLMAPPPTAEITDYELMFTGGAEQSRLLGEDSRRSAKGHGVDCRDVGKVVVSSPADGIHFDPDEHRKLAEAVAEKVRKLIG
ncbi:MAG: SGNH/GDSL hydrolase family protein [Chloroflexota bacterium]